MKNKALEYCDFMIEGLAKAINENKAEPEWIERWKESGRMWKYMRELVRKDMGGEEN